ncbi:MAG: HAD family hydrolase [Bdellovibrionales bacterium]|nr:HAD family hydrolase [Bdellovibrionales bacterium]
MILGMPVIKPNQRFKHLLMDLDGTLIHSGNFLVHLEFIGRILPLMKQHRGWRAAWSSLKQGQDALKLKSKEKTNHERLIDIFEKNLSLPREKAEKHLFDSLLKVFPKLESHFGKIPGAAKFIEWARDHYTLTLATNPVWPVELAHMRMRWGGIDPDYFNSITTSDRMHACKPDPEYYLEILEQEKFQARDCLLIGNERKMDLPATKAGIAVFLIRPDTRELSVIEKPGMRLPSGIIAPGAWRGSYTHLKSMLNEQLVDGSLKEASK